MIYSAILFFVVAIVAAVLGLGGFAAAAAALARFDNERGAIARRPAPTPEGLGSRSYGGP